MSPILGPDSLEVLSRSAEQTHRVGIRLGRLLQGGQVVCLEGPLGVGKTVLARGIGTGWGATLPVLSPSFVLIREHRRAADRQRLLHVDFYRLQDPREAWSLGLEDWLEAPDAVVVVEWPERALEALPPQRLWVRLEFANGDRRRLVFTAQGAVYHSLLQALRRAVFGG
ncbi:MAG: tRNA (adenosine(37)-N6)-threonylcarbamoyltransferase complex ATPase subunit type 1 TsaE [Anaerolineae bacterium]|nr:tRNA (adenosine(37)-N6)-threonylcarbamoyltransferase complex ATPase subunit type 1 TsaE [Anaerolineae bacterium]MDW8068512.1 tRNA (adenosine(37)-N6)-threonylcarbamoyltransferase complex ATPase subunit type 1 TsaE [Anaerolineae bacterium]